MTPSTSAVATRDDSCSRSVVNPKGREMTFFRIDPLQDPRWKAFIEWHPEASLFHTVGWLQALKSCYGYTPVAVTTSAPGVPLQDGLTFCEIRSALTGDRLVSLPFSDHCQPLVSHRETFDALIEGIKENVKGLPWRSFEVRPITYAPKAEAGLSVCNTYYFHRVDLGPSEQSLFGRFAKDSVQRKIRKAERESLRYEKGSSAKLLGYFYKLLIMTRRRQGLPPQPLKWFRSLVTSMGNELEIRVALKGETPVASILTILNKKTLVYKYGCSDVRFRNLGGTALLLWNAIQEAKANGMEEFDMGRSETRNLGLATFKERWGAKRSTVNYWRYPSEEAASKLERLVKYTRPIISIAPDISLVALGNLFYRHIG